MRNLINGSLLAALLSTTALADTSSMSTTSTGMGVLENDYVKAGVNGSKGTLGSGGSTSPGLLYDSTGSGTFNTSYDYLTPGSPFDGFAVKVDGTNYTNNNSGASGITGDGNGLTDGTDSLSWTGGVTSVFDITNTYTLGTTVEHIEIESAITMGVDADDVYFGRFIDPDAVAAAGDSSTTDNVLGYGVIPDSNVAFSEALTSRYALGLFSTDSNVDAGITGWTTDADSYTENALDSSSNTNTGDNTIGLSWHWTSVSTGDILTASYAYIFGPSAFDAADTAITAGAGGGADVSSWGTLEDVGSATDAAEGTATPTVTSTSAPTTTYGTWGAWAHDTDLPVLSQAQTTHDSSVADGVQTIDRETTTIVTTPQERSRTSTTTVVDTYSDGSTVTRTTATGTDTETRNNAVSTVTDPGAFVGRMDQMNQMLALNPHRGLGIADGFSAGRIGHDMGNGYDAESSVFGLGFSHVTDTAMTLGFGMNRISTDITGEGSSGKMDTTVLSVRGSKHIDDRDLTVGVDLNASSSDLSYARSIGDFSASGATTSSDNWVGLTVEKSTGTVRPFGGYTIGQSSHEAFAETGDVQAALLDAGNSETYRYATLGLNFDNDLINASVSRDFGDSDATHISAGVDRQLTERISANADINRTMSGDNTSTFLTAGIKWQF